MSAPMIDMIPLLAQTPAKPKPTQAKPAQAQGKAQPTQQASPATDISSNPLWMPAAGGLLLLLLALGVFTKIRLDQMSKKLRMEEFKNRELQKKYKLAVGTITKMEKNPDLVHSREFNLDYLRMRMAEETFHFAIVNQIKVKVKDKISMALRPTHETRGVGRQVDELFDVEYETGEGAKATKAVLFRIQIKLTKLPTQPTSVTIGQIIDCIETYLSTTEEHDTWQPTIQGRVAYIHWDQKAKPTPLLVLEQSNEGVNVTFRTTRRTAPVSAEQGESEIPSTAGSSGKNTSLSTGRRGRASNTGGMTRIPNAGQTPPKTGGQTNRKR
jgi:hypothetical protein